MADNFLERQYNDYLAQKAAKDKAKTAKWRQQLKAYKEKLAQQKPAEPQNLLADGVVKLRALEPTDLDLLYEWENDTRLWAVGSTLAPFSRAALWKFLQESTGDIYASHEVHFVVETIDSTPVGMLDLFGFDAHNSRCEIGVHIIPSHRRKGYALRALEIVKRYVFMHLGVNQLYATIPAFHAASVALFDRANFSEQHLMPQWVRQGGEMVDAVIAQCLKTNYTN